MVTRSQSITLLDRKYSVTPTTTRIVAVIARRRLLALLANGSILSFDGGANIVAGWSHMLPPDHRDNRRVNRS
jgi:hypothetical protein